MTRREELRARAHALGLEELDASMDGWPRTWRRRADGLLLWRFVTLDRGLGIQTARPTAQGFVDRMPFYGSDWVDILEEASTRPLLE
jgi:hypothetical protein